MRQRYTSTRFARYLLTAACLAAAAGCSSGGGSGSGTLTSGLGVETCMSCHNGSGHDDYSGPGIENPHPFGGAATLTCTACHGGNPNGATMASAHVPPPPEIGDRTQQLTDNHAWFNKLTHAGIDKFPDYMVDGTTYTSLSFLAFTNPGDVRVTVAGMGCGKCH